MAYLNNVSGLVSHSITTNGLGPCAVSGLAHSTN